MMPIMPLSCVPNMKNVNALWEWLKYWLFVWDKFGFEKSHGNRNFGFDLLALVRFRFSKTETEPKFGFRTSLQTDHILFPPCTTYISTRFSNIPTAECFAQTWIYEFNEMQTVCFGSRCYIVYAGFCYWPVAACIEVCYQTLCFIIPGCPPVGEAGDVVTISPVCTSVHLYVCDNFAHPYIRCGVFAGKTVWSTPEHLRGKVLMTKRYTNLCLPLPWTHKRAAYKDAIQ